MFGAKRKLGSPVDWDQYRFLITIDGFRIYIERKDSKPRDISVVAWLLLVFSLFILY